LQRSGDRLHLIESKARPVMIDRRVARGRAQDGERLVDQLPTFRHVDAEGAILVRREATPDAHFEPPAAQHVERADALGDVQGVVIRQRNDAEAQEFVTRYAPKGVNADLALFLNLVILLGLVFPVYGLAQSDSTEPSLGDLARSLRKAKAAPEHTVIDNDNLHKVMDEVQNRKLSGNLLFTFDGAGKKFQVSSPDVTCDLSFSGSATSLLSDAYAPQELPEAVEG